MAKSKLVQINKKIEKSVVNGYKTIENTVVNSYTKIEDIFVDRYLTKEGETVEQAKERLRKKRINFKIEYRKIKARTKRYVLYGLFLTLFSSNRKGKNIKASDLSPIKEFIQHLKFQKMLHHYDECFSIYHEFTTIE